MSVETYGDMSNPTRSNLEQAFDTGSDRPFFICLGKSAKTWLFLYLDCVLIRTETGRPVDVSDVMPAEPVTHDILLPQNHSLDAMQDSFHIDGRAIP